MTSILGKEFNNKYPNTVFYIIRNNDELCKLAAQHNKLAVEQNAADIQYVIPADNIQHVIPAFYRQNESDIDFWNDPNVQIYEGKEKIEHINNKISEYISEIVIIFLIIYPNLLLIHLIVFALVMY